MHFLGKDLPDGEILAHVNYMGVLDVANASSNL